MCFIFCFSLLEENLQSVHNYLYSYYNKQIRYFYNIKNDMSERVEEETYW